MSADLAQLSQQAQQNAEAIQGLTKSFGAFVEKMSHVTAPGHHKQSDIYGTPHIRTGEDPFTSRGYKFLNTLGLCLGYVQPDQAKVEMDIHNRMDQCLCKDNNMYQYVNGGWALPGQPGGKFLAPLATSYLHDAYTDTRFRKEMKSLVHAGIDAADPDEMKWIRQAQYKSMGYDAKTLSWINELLGGALVPPAEQGELIELLRNKEALVNAGARVVPLPPQGRLKFPRQTAASLTFWVGENAPITPTDIGTGEIILQARKLCVMLQAPNELIRFASPAAEALMRDDMTKGLALGLDLAGLEGQGGDLRPLGIIQRQNINRIISSSPGAGITGDSIVGQDIYRMVAAVEESNAEFEGFIMRPKTLYKYYQLRFDAVNQGDRAGGFLFSLIREAGDGVKPTLAGYPVTKSTQVSQVRSKAGGVANLTYVLGGMFSDVLIGMFGAIEFAATTLGDTPFRFDQTWVRGILSADIQVRHEAAFVLMDNLDTTQP